VGRGGGRDPFILNRGIMWKQVVSFTPWLLNTQYPLHRTLGDQQSQPEHIGGEKNLLLLLEMVQKLFNHPAHSLLTVIIIMF
jgi:hypothetical protein